MEDIVTLTYKTTGLDSQRYADKVRLYEKKGETQPRKFIYHKHGRVETTWLEPVVPLSARRASLDTLRTSSRLLMDKPIDLYPLGSLERVDIERKALEEEYEKTQKIQGLSPEYPHSRSLCGAMKVRLEKATLSETYPGLREFPPSIIRDITKQVTETFINFATIMKSMQYESKLRELEKKMYELGLTESDLHSINEIKKFAISKMNFSPQKFNYLIDKCNKLFSDYYERESDAQIKILRLKPSRRTTMELARLKYTLAHLKYSEDIKELEERSREYSRELFSAVDRLVIALGLNPLK